MYESEKPLASIVIVNYRGEKLLPSCLDSVLAQDTEFPFEIIVVDDDSDDGSVNLIESRYPEVRIVANQKNRGPAAAKNIGAWETRSEYIAFLDNDVELHPGWLKAMMARLTDEDEEVGACASHILLNGFGSVLNSTGGMINLLGYAWDRGIFTQDSETYLYSPNVMYACSAAMLIKKHVFDEVGGFDERFRYLFEDADLGWRMNIYGYKVAYEPGALVRHLLSSTMGDKRLRNLYLYERNRLRALIKNMEGNTLKMVRRELSFWFARRIRAEMTNGLTAKQKLVLPIRMGQALAWNTVWLPDTLQLRRAVMEHRIVPDNQLIRNAVLCPQIGEAPVGEDPRYEAKPEMNGRVLPRKAKMGKLKEGVLGSGWYEKEFDAKGIVFRWTGERAYLFLGAGKKNHNLFLHTLMAHPSGCSQVSVKINGSFISAFEVPNHYHKHHIPLPENLDQGTWEVELEVSNPFRPQEVLQVEDQRTLGVAVASIEIH